MGSSSFEEPDRRPQHQNRQFGLQWLFLGLAMLILGAYIGRVIYVDYQHSDAGERDRLLAQANVVDQYLGRQLLAADRSLASVRRDLPSLVALEKSGIPI